MLRLTGHKSYSAFIDETDPLERELLMRSIEQWHHAQADASGGAGGPPGV